MEPITYGKYYHIYNRGINGCVLFNAATNYHYFLALYGKYIAPITENFAWCLMKNHFHFLVRMKDEEEIASSSENAEYFLSRQFSNFFNAYSKAFNKKYHRHGALFERPFRRKLVEDEAYFLQLITYIHTNPVHHGLVESPKEYRWSSYNEILAGNSVFIDEFALIKHFEDIENFIFVHEQPKQALTITYW